MIKKGYCPRCEKPTGTFVYDDGDFVCRHCIYRPNLSSCRLFEFGVENPIDPKGSTAHVRDIKDRRWNSREQRQFYYSKELGKTYFFPK